MDVASLRHESGTRRQLPVKGERKNITELTAIARIRPGMYPEERLPDEYKQRIFDDIKKVMEKIIEKRVRPPNFETDLRDCCNQMVDKFFKEPKPSRMTKEQIDGFVKKLRVAAKHSSSLKNFFTHAESQLMQSDKKMTWVQHLKQFGNWAHENRQEAIRKMSTIHYARWFIVDEHTLPGIDGPHLLFTSNYDGELEGYLEDFANVDEGPLNLVFGHCIGWPGARPADGFIQYVKEHEHPALIFYANYPLATVGEVRRALDWKNKTQKFIEKDVPKLLNRTSVKSAAIARKSLSKYLNELAKPTANSEEK